MRERKRKDKKSENDACVNRMTGRALYIPTRKKFRHHPWRKGRNQPKPNRGQSPRAKHTHFPAKSAKNNTRTKQGRRTSGPDSGVLRNWVWPNAGDWRTRGECRHSVIIFLLVSRAVRILQKRSTIGTACSVYGHRMRSNVWILSVYRMHAEVSRCGKSGDLEPSGESHRSHARYG